MASVALALGRHALRNRLQANHSLSAPSTFQVPLEGHNMTPPFPISATLGV